MLSGVRHADYHRSSANAAMQAKYKIAWYCCGRPEFETVSISFMEKL